jgi:hypothetical protein
MTEPSGAWAIGKTHDFLGLKRRERRALAWSLSMHPRRQKARAFEAMCG